MKNEPSEVGGRRRDDRRLNEHGRQSADDTGPTAESEGEGAAELDAEIARRESGASHGQPGTGMGAGLTQRPPD